MTNDKRQILICQNCTCRDRGSQSVLETFQQADLPDDVEVVASDCLGQCNMGPTVRIVPEETWYCRMTPEDATTIVEQHIKGGEMVEAKLHPRIHLRFSF